MSACDDCIYTYPDCPTGEIDKKFDEVHGDNFNVVSCVNYVNNDGSYYDGHWHCHRCGKSIKVAGLCKKCDKWLSEQGGYLNAIDDSWESISK